MKIAILALTAALCAQAQFSQRRAPGFSLPDMKSQYHDLADYRGKVVVLDFMRTDCPKCTELTKTLEQVKSKYGDKLQVLAVVTMPDNLQTVQKYVAANKATSSFLFDCGQMMASYLKLSPSNPTVHLPTVFVVDGTGAIRRELKAEEATMTNLLGSIEAAMK